MTEWTRQSYQPNDSNHIYEEAQDQVGVNLGLLNADSFARLDGGAGAGAECFAGVGLDEPLLETADIGLGIVVEEDA